MQQPALCQRRQYEFCNDAQNKQMDRVKPVEKVESPVTMVQPAKVENMASNVGVTPTTGPIMNKPETLDL